VVPVVQFDAIKAAGPHEVCTHIRRWWCLARCRRIAQEMQADLLVVSWRQTCRRPQPGQDTGRIRCREQVNLHGSAPQVDEIHPATVVRTGGMGQMGSYQRDRYPNMAQIALWHFAGWWITEGHADFTALGRRGWGPGPLATPAVTAAPAAAHEPCQDPHPAHKPVQIGRTHTPQPHASLLRFIVYGTMGKPPYKMYPNTNFKKKLSSSKSIFGYK
jgi:hypothetical protein